MVTFSEVGIAEVVVDHKPTSRDLRIAKFGCLVLTGAGRRYLKELCPNAGAKAIVSFGPHAVPSGPGAAPFAEKNLHTLDTSSRGQDNERKGEVRF
jgi:hypothetical protein